eukprot:INCI6990.1.p1 GENE.INCI6990.1~~INCI6990.1.p1  ORF type:complete len:532 (-),score=114.06 INCI6990.1:2882-4477(-)
MQAARSLRDKKKRHAATEPSGSTSTSDSAAAATTTTATTSTTHGVKGSTAAAVSAESASETKGQNTWRQVRHPSPKRLHARHPQDAKETKQQLPQQQQQRRQIDEQLVHPDRRQGSKGVQSSGVVEAQGSSKKQQQTQKGDSPRRARRRRQQQQQNIEAIPRAEQDRDGAVGAGSEAAAAIADGANVGEDGVTGPANSFDIVSQCTARLGRHHAEVTVKFSRAGHCFEFDIFATGLSTRLQSIVPVSRDLAEQAWQLLQIVKSRGDDEVQKTISGVASCLTLHMESSDRPSGPKKRTNNNGSTRTRTSAIPSVTYDLLLLKSVISAEIRRVTHATQPLSKMELEQRLRADMEAQDDGAPSKAAVRVQAAYRGHFVRKFGRERSLRIVHEAHAAQDAAKEEHAQHIRYHNAFKVQRAIRTFLVRKAVNQLDVMTRVAAAESLRPAVGSFDPLDMTIEEQEIADLPDAPRLVPIPDERYRDLSSGVDEAIASARAAGEIDANRIVRDAEEGIARLKRTLELSAEAQKVGQVIR